MKTTPPAQLANVVNASVTMFFHSLQPIKGCSPGGGSPGGPASDQDAMGVKLESSADFDPPIDLVHLSRQCLGDSELEAELLAMFRLQARALAAQLSDSPPLSLESKARIAHRLRGSALAVGARRVAGAAGRIEELASTPGDQQAEEARATAALLSAVAEALAEIDRIRG
jgi:hypothetical protein